ncbi:MAG TPA: hypothetical protein VHK26_10790 [Methyloceanibacter sp.]|jgi:hypothetical protein|nr:hypothetical protein [Methyloceanibacter sp.]
MVRFSLFKFLSSAAFGASLALTVGVLPARADQPLTNLGPVGPYEPILVTVGGQRVIAFYIPEKGACSVSAVVWKDGDPDAPYASARVRISLKPGQMFQLDGAQRQSMSLFCGADASNLAIAAPAELILTNSPDSRH